MPIRTAGLLSLSGLLAAAAAPAGAQAPTQQPFKELIARGLKVVAVTLVPAEANKTADAVFVVTLQQDRTVAVCTFGVGAWENMAPIMTDSPTACDVRSY